MSHTLLIHNDPAIVDILGLSLNVYVGADVIVKQNFKESQMLIQHHPDIKLVLCGDAIDGEPTAELIHSFYKDQAKMPLIVIGEKNTLIKNEQLKIFPKKFELQSIVQTAAKFLKVTPEIMVEKVVPDYFPFAAYYGLNLTLAPCDIYIKRKGEFDLLYKIQQEMDPRFIYSLIQNGHQEIFVLAKDRIKFTQHLTANLYSILEDGSTDPKLKIGITEKSLKMIQEEAIRGESYVEMSVKILAISAIKTCMEIAKLNPQVASLLKDLLSNRSSYRYKHIQLVMYVCNHIISQLEWGTIEMKEKLAFVSFFHDICLTNDKLFKINSSNFNQYDSDLKREEKELLLKHPQMAADFIQKLKVAPIGSDLIILQHHGMVHGYGFPEVFSNELSPLSIVFIIAEEFSHLILENNQIENMATKKEEMLKLLYEKFPRPKYVKIIDTLKSIRF
ncbi:MAG: hypothetical protein AB7I27_10670 [Bacteriovoracaceae bacterium]